MRVNVRAGLGWTFSKSGDGLVPEPTAEVYRQEKELLLRPDFEQLIRNAFAEGKL